ncbi:OprD family outer membrane porin [Sulfurimonas sp.]|uniref:OprD family outer membrane porin n=1 Tax=Sulfurimonas sp. TaxID=2022749 RepID=UPI002AAF62C9|nr:OprD family outer membrane porin [Sulfurimonas sp.]
MKFIKLFFAMLIIVSCTFTASMAEDSLQSAFKNAKVEGEIRYKYVVKNSNEEGEDAEGSAIGGSFGLKTAPLYGFSLGAMAYTTNKATGSDEPFSTEPKKLTNTSLLYGDSSYTILGQAYLEYKNKNSTLKVGRQYLATPFIDGDDGSIIPNLYEAYMFTNSDISDTKITIGHVSKMSGWDSYGDITTFVSMTQAAGITSSKNGVEQYNKGVSLASVIYYGITDTVLEAWYYKAHDLVDIYYLEGMYDTKIGKFGLTLGVQYWQVHSASKYNQWASGIKEEKVDYSVYGFMSAIDIYDTKLILAYHSTDLKDSLPTIHGKWGGYPEYVFSQEAIVTTYNVSGVQAIKTGLSHDSSYGKFSVHYVIFNSRNEALENSEDVLYVIYGHDIKYINNLSVSLLYEAIRANTDKSKNQDYDYYKASITYTF